MIKIYSLGLKNYSVYKDVEFRLKRGISVVRGKNASGKSLLGHVIPLIFFEHPVASKKSKSTGQLQVRVISDEVKYSIIKQTGKSTKYRIKKNGKDLQTATIKESERYMHRAFPVSNEYFWNCIYLSSARLCVLQHCSPTERLVHFQDLFNLHVYEQIYSELKQQLRLKRANKIQFDLIEREKAAIIDQTDRPSQKLLSKLEQRNSILQKKIQRLDLQLAQNTQYEAIRSTLELDFTLEQAERKLAHLDTILAETRAMSKLYHTQLQLWQRYKESLKYANALDKAVLSKISTKFTSQRLRQIQDAEEYCKEKPDFNLKKYAGIYETVRSRYLATTSQLESLSTLNGKSVCSLCGAYVSPTHIAAERERLINDLRKLDLLCKRAKQADKYLENKKLTRVSSSAFMYLKRFVDKELEKSVQAKQYTNVTKVEKPQEVDEARLRFLEKQRDRLLSHIQSLKQLSKVSYTKITEDIDELRDKQHNVFSKLTSLRIQDEAYKKMSSRVAELNEQLMQLDVKDIDLYEILLEAYGNKGIKSRQIEVIVDSYVRKLNEFSTLLYSDKMLFSYKLDKNKCELLCERNGQVGDISTFSGFETRAFQMISALSLMCILGIKCDTMFLDEIENGMSEEHLQRFTDSFLPQLNKYVAKLVVITPRKKNELCVIDAHEYQVVKKKGQSILCVVN